MELGPNMLSLGPWIGCWTLSRLGAVQNQPLDAKYLYKILRPEYCVRAWCLFQKFSAFPASGFAQRSRSEKWTILCFRIVSLSLLHRRSFEQSLRLACFLFRQKPKKVTCTEEALRLVAFLCAPIFITATNFPFRSSRPSLTTFKQVLKLTILVEFLSESLIMIHPSDGLPSPIKLPQHLIRAVFRFKLLYLAQMPFIGPVRIC